MVQDVMGEEDVVAASGPVQVTVYEAPDTADTRTDCVEVPTWIGTLSDTTTSSAMDQKISADTSAEASAWSPASRLEASSARLAGLPYVITPVTSGRPTLSVTSRTVTLSALDPRDGSGLKYRYQVPSPTWSLDAEAGVGATVAPLTGRVRGASVTSTLGVSRHWDRVSGRLGVGLTATTDRLGATVSLTLTRTLISR
jgi:hypothetical protein